MKAIPTLALIAAGAMFVTRAPLCASETDDRIESSFSKSYAYKTYLKDDAIKTESRNGVVTLTGQVNEASHKYLAQETVAGLPGSKGWTTDWKSNWRALRNRTPGSERKCAAYWPCIAPWATAGRRWISEMA